MSAQPKDRAKLTERAGIVALGTLLSRILGLGRDLVVAACFPRIATDAFMVAFQIPNILRQLLAEGAVQNAVLPVLSATIETEGEERGKDYFKNIRGLSLTILLVVTALGIWFSPEIVLLFAPGFADRPEQFEQTVTLTRWVFPFIIFVGTTALTSAALNVHQRFTASGFSPSLPNIAFILAALLLPAWLIEIGQPPILSLAIGAVVGGALQLFAQWPSLRAIGYAGFPSLRFSDPRVGETVRRMAPTLIGIGVYYLDVILGRRILSELGEGAVTYFGFALRLCDFPQGIFVMALQTATLPSLAALAARGQHEELSETFGFSVRLSLFVGLGAGALLVGLAEPLVRLLFERGEFGAEATTDRASAHLRVLRARGYAHARHRRQHGSGGLRRLGHAALSTLWARRCERRRHLRELRPNAPALALARAPPHSPHAHGARVGSAHVAGGRLGARPRSRRFGLFARAAPGPGEPRSRRFGSTSARRACSAARSGRSSPNPSSAA
jgi:putative peptidoglycan lipid II flippase